MLVITRKVGEQLLVGDEIEVVVLGVEGQRVRLGVQAPKEIPILRKEVLEEVQHLNEEAAKLPMLEGFNEWLKQLTL